MQLQRSLSERPRWSAYKASAPPAGPPEVQVSEAINNGLVLCQVAAISFLSGLFPIHYRHAFFSKRRMP